MKNIITLWTLFLCLTSFGVNITNYPLTNNYSGNELFLLSSIPWKTNFNLPGNYVAKTSDLNSASNSILAQMPTTNGFVDSSVTNGLQGALINPLTNGHSVAVTISNALTVTGIQTNAGRILVDPGASGFSTPSIASTNAVGVGVHFSGNTIYLVGGGIARANWGTTMFSMGADNGDDRGLSLGSSGVGPFLSRDSNSILQFGQDAASPIAQTIKACDARSGTDTDKPGADLTVAAGRSTGTGIAGTLYFATGGSSNATGKAQAPLTNWMAISPSGAVTLGSTLTATNGVVTQRMPCTSNAVTVVAGQQIYCVNGTNQLITLPAANVTWVTNIIYRFTSTNGWGSFIITNGTGAQSIRDGTSLSLTNIGIGEISLFSDGAAWWLASKARTILPSASWSSATTITPAQDVITNIPWTDLEYNNSQGLTLRTNATFARPTELWVTNSGTYMITFSAVLKGAAGGSVISLWLRKNGTDVARTRTDQMFSGTSAQQCMTVNYFTSVGAPTYFELCAASHDATPPTIVGGTANPTGYTAPAMPAVIVTINRVSDPWP